VPSSAVPVGRGAAFGAHLSESIVDGVVAQSVPSFSLRDPFPSRPLGGSAGGQISVGSSHRPLL
jgi:hypothetical protein